MFDSDVRGVTPVVAIALLVVIVLLLASSLFVSVQFVTTELPDGFDLGGGGSAAIGAQSRGVIMAVEDDPGAPSAEHRVEYPIPSGSNLDGDSLNSVQVRYLDDSVDLNLDERSDVERIGIDTDGDGTIETNATDDLEQPSNGGVEVTGDGTELNLDLSGNYNLNGGDTLIVVYDQVGNPHQSGVYPGSVRVNGYSKLSRLGTVYVHD